MDKQNLRQKFNIIRGQLYNERSTFESHWRQLGDFILPNRPRFFVSDANRGDRRNQNIVDSTGTMALRTTKAGMMTGITSPARPWFKLTTPDPNLAESGNVKRWVDDVTSRMRTVFLRSNLYNVLPTIYGDTTCFGTAAMTVVPDMDKIIYFESLPIGSYYIAKDNRDKVNTLMREFRMTIRQLIDEFGIKNANNEVTNWENFSLTVRSQYEQGLYETWIDVVHMVRPNENYNPNKIDSKYKKFFSCYYETGVYGSSNYMSDLNGDTYLRESGFDYFPAMCPRWEKSGEDVYGTDCPGMVALGDIKQLQTGERRVAQAIEKMLNPTMIGPTSMRKSRISGVAGDVIFADEREGQKGYRPTHEVDPRINEMENKQQQVRQRISRAFFEDLFLMLANSDRRQITAREIEERHEEKLLALGPVLEQLNQDLLDPLIDITFFEMNKRGMIPHPPEELQGTELKVEYISIMAQAQKLVGVATLERFSNYVIGLGQADPTAVRKVKFDKLIDQYADATSIHSSIIRTDEEMEEMQAQEQQAMQQQRQMEAISNAAATAKDLSQSDLTGDNVLNRLVSGAQR